MSLRYLSVCSGVEAATVAWDWFGMEPVGFSEIEDFPATLLETYFPEVPNFGDMNNYKEWPDVEFEVLVGGTPCQSFSVAGLRKGLEDPRGNLALVYVGLLDRFRPDWFVWENVPGVLSSNGGRDFGAFLGALAEIGYGFCYRVLDAQFFGVPQRRRRVFVVGHLGGWRGPAAVLLEREGLCRHLAKGRKARESTTHDPAPCLGASGRGFSRVGDPRGQDPVIPCNERGRVVAHTLRGEGFDGSEDGTGRGTPLVSVSHNPVCTLTAREKKGWRVRRLTPRECERLQGFPDDWTLVDFAPGRRKKPRPVTDGHRYKAVGNSMAVPCMRWIGKRLTAVDELLKKQEKDKGAT